MKNILNFFTQSKLRTNLIILAVVIVLIIVINAFTGVLQTKKSPSTEPLIPSLVTTTSTTTSPLPTPVLNIKWNEVKDPQTPEKLYEYSLVSPLTSSDNQNRLPSLLGFSNSQKVTVKDTNISIWSNSKHSLVINTKNNSIIYSTNNPPVQDGPLFTQENSLTAARKIIKDLFGEDVEATLINQRVDYYKTFNIYSSPSTIENADLVRVSFYQSINQFPVLAQSETGAVFTFYLDHNLNIHSISIVGGFTSVALGKELVIYPFVDVKKLANSAQRLNASPDLDVNFQTASSKKIDLSVSQSQIGYLQIQNVYLPIYILEGNLTGTNVTQQSGIYALPASK